MTSKERLAAYIAGERVDRRPNLTIVGSAVCRYANGGAGMDVETYCKDYMKMAEAASVAAREMKLDFIQIASDLLREAEGYGTTINWFADKLPSAKKYALDDISEVDGLHTLKAREIPRLYNLVEAAKAALSNPDVDPMVLAVGPMTVAGNIRGVQDFLVDMFDEPELCEKLLEIVTGTTLDFIDCLSEAGVKYAYVADPVASLVSPAAYEKMVFPMHRKIFDRMAEHDITGRLHMCGNTTGILPYSSICGAKIVDVDHMVDFDRALDIAGERCILNGNIDPVADVYTCEASHTKDAVLAVAKKAVGRRAMFMPGCELPTDTSIDNILAIHEALKEIGG